MTWAFFILLGLVLGLTLGWWGLVAWLALLALWLLNEALWAILRALGGLLRALAGATPRPR